MFNPRDFGAFQCILSKLLVVAVVVVAKERFGYIKVVDVHDAINFLSVCLRVMMMMLRRKKKSQEEEQDSFCDDETERAGLHILCLVHSLLATMALAC